MTNPFTTISKLYADYLTLTNGDPSAAATLVLAHTSLDQRAQKPVGAPLSPAEAAKYLGVSVDTIYGLCNEGRLRHQRVGVGRGVIRIAEADLSMIAQEITKEPKAEGLFAKHAARQRRRP